MKHKKKGDGPKKDKAKSPKKQQAPVHKKKKAHPKKVNKAKLTDEERAELEAKEQERLQQERDRKEKEKYEKYVKELRQQNYRAALLADALKSIASMCIAHNKQKRKHFDVKKWNEYISCSSLPNVRDPPNVRMFLYRWKREIEEDLKNFFSWVLDVDENSMLTQDLRKKNQCFWKLYSEQPVIGERYTPRIDQCLNLLKQLDIALHESHDPVLAEIKEDLRNQQMEAIDYFTIRILTNVERDMNRINSCSANFNFKSDSFCLSLWSTRPVPQLSLNWRSIGVTDLEFPVIDVIILLPNQIETDGFSFRGLLMNYDHYSDMAATSHLNIKFPRTPDLREANEIEWNKKEEIMHAKLDEMRAERAKFEKKEEERLIKEAEMKKDKKGKQAAPEKTEKKHKPKQPPLVVTETTVIDVSEDYLKYEDDLYMQQKSAMSPEAFNMSENEINLRKFQILGGVYELHYLVRPPQYTELKQQFLYKVDSRQILKQADFLATTENELIEIQLILSDRVNWWFAPIVCYWQPWEESEEFLALSPELQDFHINHHKYIEKLESLLFSEPQPHKNYNLVKCFKDFILNEMPMDIDFYQLINDYLVPRMPITYKFNIELNAEKEILRKAALREKEIEMEKTERNQKRRAAFDNEMKEYLANVLADVNNTVTETHTKCEQFYVTERIRLINHGENELQIDRYLKHRREVDDEKMRDIKTDALANYQEYVEEQFKNRILSVEDKEGSSAVAIKTHAKKLSPRDLFPTKPRPLPIKIINEESVYNFDVPNEDNPPEYDAEVTDDLLLSTFFRYLVTMFEKSKPTFKETAKIEETEVAIAPDVNIPVLVDEKSLKTKTKSGGKAKSTKKHKAPKKLGSAKSGKKNSKSPVSKKSAESNGNPAKKSPRSKSTEPSAKAAGSPKKRPRTKSASSKKSSKSGSSRKGSKSPKKKSRKKKRKREDEIAPPPSEEENPTSGLPVPLKKSRQNKILNLIPHFNGKWITSGVNMLDFNIETREAKLNISRFGLFGFAMPKYSNFPLKYWEVYPNAAKKHSVLLKVVGIYAEIKIQIDEDGYLIERIVPNNINFVRNNTAIGYRKLKNFLLNSGFNIFPDRDAGVYVENISEKHRSMEDHTYYCAAQFSLSHYFRMSEFNRLSHRRICIIELYETRENVQLPDHFTQIMVTPQQCNFIVPSVVTTKTGEMYIDYKIEPVEQEYYPDVYNLVLANCNDLSLKLHDQMKGVHRYNVARLLCAIRPLSFG